jgi:hypothetical protein
MRRSDGLLVVLFLALLLDTGLRRRCLCMAMLAKNKRPYDPDALPDGKRLRENLKDIFANNLLAAGRVQEVIDDIADCDVPAMHSLRSSSMRGDAKSRRVMQSKNASRNLTRKLLKGNQWPPLYHADIRVKDLKTGDEVWQRCSFLLPHEFVNVLEKFGDHEQLLSTRGLDPLSASHLHTCQAKAKARLVPLGLWGDGVPCNWDRSDSVETFSLNLPGQVGKFKPLRLPLTALARKQVSAHTWDDIMEVLSWSLRSCSTGVLPSKRHDGAEWLKSDRARAKAAESGTVGCRAALVEVRGDWKFYGETFRFPKHNTKAGCCWKCPCTPDQAPRGTFSF